MSKITIPEAIKTIQSGQIIIYPTEGVWGLGADPLNQGALNNIYALKQRPTNKPFLVIAASLTQVAQWTSLTRAQTEIINTTTNTPTTWLVPASSDAPESLTLKNKIAFRISSHPTCQALCNALGSPIISTSANHHGQPVKPDMFSIDFPDIPVVQGQLGNSTQPSRIIDIVTMQQLR